MQSLCLIHSTNLVRKMGIKRFKTLAGWALIPGPAELMDSMSSQDLQFIQVFSPVSIAESLLSFPRMRLLQSPSSSWYAWRARWESDRDFIEIGMTLFEDELESWGGSPISADCRFDQIEALWLHLQARHHGVWLHDPNCVIHTRESLQSATTV